MTLERVDIIAEVSMMVSSVAIPRERHLQQVFDIFAFLKKKVRVRVRVNTLHKLRLIHLILHSQRRIGQPFMVM